MTDHREAIAEVLGAHRGLEQATRPARRKGITEWFAKCVCGEEMPWPQAERNAAHRAHLAEALADLLAAERQRGREEALREAAKEAEERGDIGKDGGCEAWTWLRIRADRITETP